MNLTLPVTLAYVLIVILIVTMMLTSFVLLINKKVEMIYLLRPYTYKLEDRGYLSAAEEDTIKTRMRELGFHDYQIEIDGDEAGFGGIINFNVSSEYGLKWFDGFLSHHLKEVEFNYHREIIVKRIVN